MKSQTSRCELTKSKLDTFFIREKKDTLQLIDHNVLPFTNRGYAANCRVKRLDEMSELEQEIMALDEDYAAAYEEVLRKEALILKQDIPHAQHQDRA